MRLGDGGAVCLLHAAQVTRGQRPEVPGNTLGGTERKLEPVHKKQGKEVSPYHAQPRKVSGCSAWRGEAADLLDGELLWGPELSSPSLWSMSACSIVQCLNVLGYCPPSG